MLDEIKEYEQYTYPLNAENPTLRLCHGNICNSLSGLARAMTIIARHSYFNYDGPDKIDHTRNDLQVWCGDPAGNPDNASEDIAFAWLPNYMIRQLAEKKFFELEDYLTEHPKLNTTPHYSAICSFEKELYVDLNIDTYHDKNLWTLLEDKAKNLKTFCDQLGNQKLSSSYSSVYNIIKTLTYLKKRSGNGFNKELFNEKQIRPDINDFKVIRYDKIIADAITAGPLKRHYLISEKSDFSKITYQTDKKISYPFDPTEKSKSHLYEQEHADRIKKAVAAFLLEQKCRKDDFPHNGCIPVGLTDAANWFGDKTDKYKKYLNAYGFESRPLFTFESLDNVVAVSIDAKWMTACGWKIISEEKLEDYLSAHPDVNFYRDDGAGELLKKGIRYSD